MPNTNIIGIDLGGTKLAAALFTRTGKILRKSVVPLEGRQGRAVGELICGELKTLLAAARAKRVRVSAIGVSVPGISHSGTGKVWAPNIPGWEDYPLRREILAALPDKRIQVVIDSDRAAYILGETWRGVAKGCRNAIFLAVGTGIGAGILIDGRILRGAHDIAGAIGWLALDRPFRREYAGCGCFEYHASGVGLAKVANELLAASPGGPPRYSITPSLHDSILPLRPGSLCRLRPGRPAGQAGHQPSRRVLGHDCGEPGQPVQPGDDHLRRRRVWPGSPVTR